MRAQRLLGAVAFVIGLTSTFTGGWAQESSNQFVTMTWSFRNNHPNTAFLQLYAVQGSRTYPGKKHYFKLDDSNAHDTSINCWAGEKICYGAWTGGGAEWGVGPNNKHGCDRCCAVCAQVKLKTRNLDP